MTDENIGMKTINKTGMVGKLAVCLYIEASFNVNIIRQYRLQYHDNNRLHSEIETRRISYDTLSANQSDDQDTER